jgi:hypothetical protein
MAHQAKQQRFVVLALNTYADEVRDVLGHDLIELLFGVTAQFIELVLPDWYFNAPLDISALDEIGEIKPELNSKDEVREWTASQEFGTFVADRVAEELGKNIDHDIAQDSTCGVVRVIVLRDNWLSKYVYETLTKAFPNALMFDEKGEAVTYNHAVSLKELNLSKKIQSSLIYGSRRRIRSIGELVHMNETEVLHVVGIGPISLEAIKAALKEHGLELRQD